MAWGCCARRRTFAEIARVGPIASQARLVQQLLEDPARTAVVAVATAEETPVNETLELQDRLTEQLGYAPAAIVVNAVLRDPLSAAELEAVAAADGVSSVVAHALHTRHERTNMESAQLRRLRRHARVPVVTLPYVVGGAIGPDEVTALAALLERRLA